MLSPSSSKSDFQPSHYRAKVFATKIQFQSIVLGKFTPPVNFVSATVLIPDLIA